MMFSMVAAQIYIPTNSAQVFHFLHIFAGACYLIPLIITILKKNLIGILICSSLMISDLEDLFM